MQLLMVTAALFVWMFVVMQFLSRWAYGYCKRFEGVPCEYVGRKVVHSAGGGIVTLLIPIFYEGQFWIVVVSAFLLAGYVVFRRKWRPMYWFQVRENAYEVHFALAYGTVLAVGVAVGNVWVGLIPMLFMSFGDSATGLVRACRQRRHVKSWDGTIAMLAVCICFGVWRLGLYGVPVAVGASLVERVPGVDDNVTIPVLSAALVYLQPLLSL